VQLLQVELLSNAKVNKDFFVVMKAAKRLFKSSKSAGHMRGKLSQVQKVKQHTHSTKYARRCLPIRKSKVNNKAQQDTAYCLMLMARDMRKECNALWKERNAVIWWNDLTSCVDFRRPKSTCTRDPLDEMLHNTLKQLMKYVGSDGDVDVYKRQRFPEWFVYRLDVHAFTSCMKSANIAVSKSVGIKRLVEITGWIAVVFAQLTSGNSTLRTPPVECTSYQGLLRVIANENGEDGVAPSPDPIATCHRNAGFSIQCHLC
jgi:hypothetical protein